jgi:hypothetical protein
MRLLALLSVNQGTEALFARKFDSDRDPEILDLIDQAILQQI